MGFVLKLGKSLSNYYHITMKCIICHGDNIKVVEVNEEIVHNNDIIYVPVKIPVCQTCGERYYDRTTMQYLERTQKSIRENQVSLKETGKVLVLG